MKIGGQYLTKLCVEYCGLLYLAHGSRLAVNKRREKTARSKEANRERYIVLGETDPN